MSKLDYAVIIAVASIMLVGMLMAIPAIGPLAERMFIVKVLFFISIVMLLVVVTWGFFDLLRPRK